MEMTTALEKDEIQRLKKLSSYDPAVAFYLIRKHTQAIESILEQVDSDTPEGAGGPGDAIRWAEREFAAASRTAGLIFSRLGVPAAQDYIEGNEPSWGCDTLSQGWKRYGIPVLPCGTHDEGYNTAGDGICFYLGQMKKLIRRKNKAKTSEFLALLDKLDRAIDLGLMGSFGVAPKFRQNPEAVRKALEEIGADMAAEWGQNN
jgi:hypothetical protein